MTSTTTDTKARRRLGDRIFAKRSGLPPITASSKQTLRIPMRDGIEIGADLYLPEGDTRGLLLTRGPYGRSGMMAIMSARLYASQGFAVLFTSSRGTADSDGDFDPMRTESDDGHDTIEWMRQQPWYPGSFATIGGSYLGHTQWAVLGEQPEGLVTSVIQVGPHDFARHAWGTGTFNLDFIGWSEQIVVQKHASGPASALKLATSARRLKPIMEGVPLSELAATHFGDAAPWVRERLETPDIDAPYWQSMRHADAVDAVTTPVLLLTGWQDIFLRQSIEQYTRLHERGIDVGLTIGPWTHIALAGDAGATMAQDTLAWLEQRLDGRSGARRPAPVKIFVTGAEAWEDHDSWPPASTPQRLYLSPGTLDTVRPGETVADSSFDYEPNDPTPTIGGPIIQGGGYMKDTKLAAREDVLVYTGQVLASDITVIGTPSITVAHHSERADADLFVRISEVDARGRSRNITEGYTRLPLDRGPEAVELDLLPTAHRFTRGNRISVLIAGGSFPQFARNPGTGENPLTATELVRNRHTVSHRAGATCLTIPVIA